MGLIRVSKVTRIQLQVGGKGMTADYKHSFNLIVDTILKLQNVEVVFNK